MNTHRHFAQLFAGLFLMLIFTQNVVTQENNGGGVVLTSH